MPINSKNAKKTLTGKYQLYTGETLNWFQVICKVEMSVIPVIFPWVIFFLIYGFLVTSLYDLGLPVAFPEKTIVLNNAVLSFNLGLTLLLVFRTNTAHERFWEGRKILGSLVSIVRNLAQKIYIFIEEYSPKDKLEKKVIIRLLVAFAIATKLHLRSEPLDESLAMFMSDIQYFELKCTYHPPLQIAFWIRDYLQLQYERNCLNIYQLIDLHKLVDEMVDVVGGCERILRTPLPLIYTINLKILVIIYCLTLPLEVVSGLIWWTGIVMAFVSFTLLSIEEIGSEIEEPFGHDPNDLPLNLICKTMEHYVEELITFAPNVSRLWQIKTPGIKDT
ncbi:hypothetical protein BZZ01_00520 [Nostocales cyanobacterium HT-58-2]|nr:hypothetical protein BZZ01_00520 [Nostocales cyanobacterium HT-58-2]